MKTSLVSPFAEVAPAALSKSITVKADRPQQLQSVTIYWRGRKMVLMQRPQRRLSALLCKMLRRSWQNLFGTLVRAIGVGAMAAALTAQAGVASSLPANTLPTPVSQNPVQSGAATITQAGNQMTVTQTSNKAIIDWQSFSIGSSAGVNFQQNNASSVALNRVVGNDPSIIMGSLTANGKIFLINAAGILVGKTGKIDVAGFTASTLNISDADFLAGKMNFAADAGKTIGNVTNKGAITSADGGSVYLIGANVKNAGIITSPDGQVLLAAGSSVQLADTSLPGVTINVGGIDGKVTNLGQIIASAGTIGIGAALIDNSGIISASSVDKQGGRIFLRATKQLTTDATSKINADGATGGNVQLYSDQVANIDGDVSALGSAGKGGYVDTSGKTVLSVQYVPRVGAGGEWYIDPHNVTIVANGDDYNHTPIDNNGVITANGDSSNVLASTIVATLNTGTNVTISTSNDESTQKGNITVSAAITKSGGNIATLTLNAGNNITINNNISSSGGSGMNLVLTANNGNVTQALSSSIAVNSLSVTAGTGITLNSTTNVVSTFSANNTASGNVSFTNGGTGPLTLNGINNNSATGNTNLTATANAIINSGGITISGGNLTVSSASFDNYSMLSLGGGTATFSSDLHNTASGIVAGPGKINLTGGTETLINDGHVQISTSFGAPAGTLIIGGNYQQNIGGTLQARIGRTGGISGTLISDQFKVNGNVSLAGALNINPIGDYTYTGQPGDKVAIVNYVGTWAGAFAVNGLPSNLFPNYLLPISSSGHDISLAYAPAGSSYFTGAAHTLNWGDAGNWFNGSSADVYIDTGSGNTVTHTAAVYDAIQALTIASGGLDVSNGTVSVNGIATVNSGGSLRASGTSELDLYGNTVINGSFATSDTAFLHIEYSGALSGSGTLGINGGSLTVDGSINAGAGNLSIGAQGTLAVDSGGSIRGKNISLTTTGGYDINILGTLSATGTGTSGTNGAVTLNSAGAISSAYYTDVGLSYGSISGGALSATANGTIALSGANNVSSFTANSAGGYITLNNSGDLNVNNVSAIASTVTLNSAGAITQNTSASAGITTGQLNVNAVNGITLNSSGNNVSAFNAFNSSKGNISLTNASNLLTLSGNIENDAVGGNATIINSGDITATAAAYGGYINGTDVLGGVTFTSTAGNVTLGRVNASNLTVSAAGSISQESSQTGGLTITGTMTATANTGIKLDNGNLTSGINHVANFGASNNGTGDITLVNNDFPTDLVQVKNTLVSIHNAGGNISVENTGGMTTVGLVDAPAGTIHLFTHSPLTIGTGGISAGNGVTLAAGTSGSPGDVLTVNGVIQTVSGTVAFAGNSVLSNAAIYGPNAPVFNSPNPVVFGSNYVYATSQPNLTPVTPPIVPPNLTPVTPLIVPPASVINTIDQNVASTTSTNNENNNNNTGTLLPLLMITTTTTLTKTSTDQTIGGSDGEFGGSTTKDDTKATPAKSNKPLPVCT